MTSDRGEGGLDWDAWASQQWAERRPSAVAPVPAAGRTDLRGRRVVVGLPGLGWRADLRADEPVVQGSRTYVPILPEQEWYRAESEQIEVFAPLMPIERVWLETTQPATSDPVDRDLVARLVSLDAPPRRDPLPARDVLLLTGRRVVRMTERGEERNLRAITEPFSNGDGDICVLVSAELDWYRWAWSGQSPKTLEVPVHLLWVE
ncbi:MAG TPA: hypothetical protein VFE14_02260 [Micromonosporaceae bacterium]|jgi:hypothetical protein|nr:hypothetical protein [Micromonosporaceae bacterium]